uniref:GAF domain-containing protein n=1 Tax=Candidatus Kentrum sp. LFY TaxID=2126342 RepID=A0A450UFF8_9GAMM|nr:MAG: GAF domain-containing protein [Candidatus Kentron sp. LFY]
MIPKPEALFQTVSELAHRITGRPVVIWVKDFETGEVAVRGQAGFDGGLVMVSAIASMDEGAVACVMATGRERMVSDIRSDPVFRKSKFSQSPNSLAVLARPVPSRGGETVGVIGFFGEEPDQLARLDRKTLTQITDIIAGQAEPSRRIFHLARATRQLIESRNLNDVSKILARTAKDLTGAVSSVVWLWNDRTREFTHASHAAGMAWSVKPRRDGWLGPVDYGREQTHQDRRCSAGWTHPSGIIEAGDPLSSGRAHPPGGGTYRRAVRQFR